MESRNDQPHRKESVVAEEGESDLETSPESSKLFLDISELNIEFNTSEAEMKIFSEDETLRSTSVEESLSKSTQDVEELSLDSSSCARSKENINKRSLKEKLRHKFTSPGLERRPIGGSSGNCLGHTQSVKGRLADSLTPELARKRRKSAEDAVQSTALNKSLVPPTGMGSNASSLSSDNRNNPEAISPQLDDSQASEEDGKSDISFALIDAELMAKLTKLRSSASETSSASIADATISDNETFTLASSAASPPSVPNPVNESQDPVVQSLPPSIMTESCPALPDEHQSKQTRPSSVIDSIIPSSGGLSPPTPQGGDMSTFMEIQYHPLSDTTEPSTPSGGEAAQEFPARGERFSPSLSSGSNSPPLYENVDNSSPYENVHQYTSTIKRKSSLPKSQAKDDNVPIDEAPAYQNVSLVAPSGLLETALDDDYEVYTFKNGGQSTPSNSIQSVDKSSNNDSSTKIQSPGECYSGTISYIQNSDESHSELSPQRSPKFVMSQTRQIFNENIPCVDSQSTDAEEVVKVPNFSKEFEDGCSGLQKADDDLQAVIVDGEVVYQQVKYLRRSIQEVNDLIEESHVNREIMDEPSVQDECLESPMTSPSVLTEVLVLPSFASPTESTTDEVTSSEVSDFPQSPSAPPPPHCISTSPSSLIPPLSPSSPPSTSSPVPLPRSSLPQVLPRLSHKTSPKDIPSPDSQDNCSSQVTSEVDIDCSSDSSKDATPLQSSPIDKNCSSSSHETLPNSPSPKNLPPLLLRNKTSPDLTRPSLEVSEAPTSHEAEDVSPNFEEDEAVKRERIEKYKEERRMFLREKYKSESFRGERDEMLLRLKQKAISPSRVDGEEEEGNPTSHGFDLVKHSQGLEESHSYDVLGKNNKENASPLQCPKQVDTNDNIGKRETVEQRRLSGNGVSYGFPSRKTTPDGSAEPPVGVHDKNSVDGEDINVKERVAVWTREYQPEPVQASEKNPHLHEANPKVTKSDVCLPPRPVRRSEGSGVSEPPATKLKPMRTVSCTPCSKFGVKNSEQSRDDSKGLSQNLPKSFSRKSPPIINSTKSYSSSEAAPSSPFVFTNVRPACDTVQPPSTGVKSLDRKASNSSPQGQSFNSLKPLGKSVSNSSSNDCFVSESLERKSGNSSITESLGAKCLERKVSNNSAKDFTCTSPVSKSIVQRRVSSDAVSQQRKDSAAALPSKHTSSSYSRTGKLAAPALTKPSAVSQQRRIKDMAAMFEGGHS